MEQEKIVSRRLDDIDLLKVLAICAVLLIHCSANRFAMFEVGSNRWLATAFWGSVSRWAMPMFLMCSGALMNDLSRELPLKKLFGRYLLRLALALSVWAGLYELLHIYNLLGTASLYSLFVQAAKNWLYGNTHYHLYYFYFAIALYLALPLTRLITRYATKTELRLFLLLWFTAGCVIPLCKYLPFFRNMTVSLLQFSLAPLFLAPGLGLLGWYLHRNPPATWYSGVALFCFGFAVVFLGTWLRSSRAGTLDTLFLDGFNLFVLLMAVGLFRLAQRWTNKHPNPRWIALLSCGSFCIYLIHPYFQQLVLPEYLTALAPYWGVPLQAAILLALSLLAYLIVRKIPLINRWLI